MVAVVEKKLALNKVANHDCKFTTLAVFFLLFSRDEATLYERVSAHWMVGWSVRP